MSKRGHVFQWVVYESPADRPGAFVARKFICSMGPEPVATDDVLIAADIEPLRDWFASRGMICFHRHPADEPQIREAWM